MASSSSRLLSELRDVSAQEVPVMFAQPDEDDIQHWHAMVMGPAGTPYSLGFFHFDMRFPPDYPNNAPKVLITTTSGGQVRFNPNLYSTGKVCLSILGTWRAEHSGEQWSAVQSVSSLLLSIQSLMHDKPYHNEPSFEADDGSGDPQKYNEKILHETLRVAVCEVMEDTLEQRAVSSNGVTATFADTRYGNDLCTLTFGSGFQRPPSLKIFEGQTDEILKEEMKIVCSKRSNKDEYYKLAIPPEKPGELIVKNKNTDIPVDMYFHDIKLKGVYIYRSDSKSKNAATNRTWDEINSEESSLFLCV